MRQRVVPSQRLRMRNTQYVINDSHVTVEAENVHLLVDELSQGDTAEGDAANESQQILKNYW